jgi:hypothetical protein
MRANKNNLTELLSDAMKISGRIFCKGLLLPDFSGLLLMNCKACSSTFSGLLNNS